MRIFVFGQIRAILAQRFPIDDQRFLYGPGSTTATIAGGTPTRRYGMACAARTVATRATLLSEIRLMTLQDRHMHTHDSRMVMFRCESDPSVVVQVQIVDPLGQGHELVDILLAGSFPWIDNGRHPAVSWGERFNRF